MSNQKPREFWLRQVDLEDGSASWKVFGPGVWQESVKDLSKFTHVIEHRAYEEAMTMLKIMESALKTCVGYEPLNSLEPRPASETLKKYQAWKGGK